MLDSDIQAWLVRPISVLSQSSYHSPLITNSVCLYPPYSGFGTSMVSSHTPCGVVTSCTPLSIGANIMQQCSDLMQQAQLAAAA